MLFNFFFHNFFWWRANIEKKALKHDKKLFHLNSVLQLCPFRALCEQLWLLFSWWPFGHNDIWLFIYLTQVERVGVKQSNKTYILVLCFVLFFLLKYCDMFLKQTWVGFGCCNSLFTIKEITTTFISRCNFNQPINKYVIAVKILLRL